ncbi:MAG: SLC13/DASS family transporter [Planctomycetales bacterium]|nr:SLC13/DASS family transporter [Planctomycetales bacterium]
MSSNAASADHDRRSVTLLRVATIIAAVAVAALVYWALGYAASGGAEGLSPAARAVAAIGAMMALLWMTQAVPLAATALLPLVLFPLTGVSSPDKAAAPYAHPLIFLFLGGFLIAETLCRCKLDRRIALLIVHSVGVRPSRLVGGFMAATALLSMWISNTATTMMMLPIAVSLLGLLDARPKETGDSSDDESYSTLATSLLLGVAYASSIGGLATLIGTPPNLVLAGYVKSTYDVEIGFGRWMAFAAPLSLLFLVLAWLLLTKILFRADHLTLAGGREIIGRELQKLGPVTFYQWAVLSVFTATALAWMLREPLAAWPWLVARAPWVSSVNDTTIAVVGALVLFALPVDWRRGQFALDSRAVRNVPWDVLVLFGGGLSVADAVRSSGLGDWLGQQVAALGNLPPWAIIALATALVIFLTELTSNTATATTFLPILGGVAAGIGLVEPLELLAPAALAASCAFMMPVATPPNAIVFGSGRLSLGSMMWAGWWLNWLGIVVIPLLAIWWGGWIFSG